MQIEKLMMTCPVIPVIVIDDIADAVPLAQALVNGGLKVLEVTLRTACGLEAIKLIKAEVVGSIVGAGTVITPQDCNNAIAAGAEFLVSPGSTQALVDEAAKSDVPLLAGAATASEVMALLASGIKHMKFFPAEAAGGVAMLKSIAGPLPQVKFCPTGGINESLAPSYLALENVLCIGGTWMLDKKLIAAKDWTAIEDKARTASKL